MFEHLLVPLDGSRLAECVLPHTVALAEAFGARVTLLSALERAHETSRSQSVSPLGWQIRRAEASTYLGGMTGRLQELDVRTESVILEGQAAERIIEFARDNHVELIVISSHGRSGLSGWNVSSVVQKIVLRAYVPVMIVRAYQPFTNDLRGHRYRRMLVPLDCSQRAECVLPLATTLAQFHESQLILAHVVSRPETPHRVPLTQEEIELANQITERNQQEAARYLEGLCLRLGVDVETRLIVADNAASALHELVDQERVDLVVLSAHGYTGGTKWPYGSVALSFVAYGATPLLIVQDLSPGEIERTQAEMAAREYKGH